MALLRTLGVLSLLLALWPGCNGCKNSATPPTPVFGDVQLGVRASLGSGTAALKGISLLEGDLTVDEVRFNLRRVDLKPDTVTDSGVEYEGPFVINLVQGGEVVDRETPPLGRASVPVDTYSRVRFRIDPVRSEELPSGLEADPVVQSSLVGNTIVIEGRFEESDENDLDGSGDVSEIPFRFVSDIGADLRLSIPDPFNVLEGQVSFIFLTMRFTSWLGSAISYLQDLSPEDLTEGVVVLRWDSDRETIRELANLIEDAIRSGTRFAESEDDEEFEEEEVDEGSYSEIDFDEEEDEEEEAEGEEDGEEGGGGQGEPEPIEDELRLLEVRMCVKEIELSGEQGRDYEGRIVLSLVRQGEAEAVALPPFESLGIPAREYEKLEVPLDKLKTEEIPEGARADAIVTRLLVDSTFVVVGSFRESPANDIDGNGAQSDISFTLISDDNYEMVEEEGVTEDIGSLIFPRLAPTLWFEGTLPLFQGLDPSTMADGQIFLSDSAPSDAIRTIVTEVEANFRDTLP